jgi:KaiC/GvpD/RAD55 family RecA-like ATPase
MHLRLHSRFLDALAGLSVNDQKRVRDAIARLSEDDLRPGLRMHNVGDFVSLSAGMDLRILAVLESLGIALVYVDHHDDAYQWARRHSAVLGDDDLLMAVVPTSNQIITDEKNRFSRAPTVDRFDALPSPIARILNCAQSEQELLDVICALSPEWQELALAVTEMTRDFSTPSDIVAVDDELLQFALSLPMDKWRVFLHPVQRSVVELATGSNLLIKGGPGTGKTVCLVHRFVRIANERTNGKPRFIALNRPAREAFEAACKSLGHVPSPESIVDFDALRNRAKLDEFVDSSSSVIVDEGQDIPVGVIAHLLERIERGAALPPITIAYDPNQAILEPAGDALARFQAFADSITLTYCYRMTNEIRAYSAAVLDFLHTAYVGKKFQDQHHIEARRDRFSAEVTTGVTGPEVEELFVSADQISKAAEMTALQLFGQEGSWENIGVIVVGKDSTITQTLEHRNIPVFTPASVKGLEFRQGVVVDNIPRGEAIDGVIPVTAAGYRDRSGLYVAITRFRDQVTVIRLLEPEG